MSKILFVGAGNMGSAILSAVLAKKIFLPKDIFLLEKNTDKSKKIAKKFKIRNKNWSDIDIIFLAVKPQNLSKIFPLPIKITKKSLLISILAGKKVSEIQKFSNISQISRVMPNVPAIFGEGMSVIFFPKNISEKNKQICRKIFKACGQISEIDDEEKMHVITAISGSGPAYFFYFLEKFQKAAEGLGISKNLAEKICLQTFFGSSELLKKSKQNPQILREKVTSPGGTTEAAIEFFEKSDFKKIIEKAVLAAKKRSEKL